MKKRIPIGVSDFKSIIEENYYFVDKSLFIKEVIEDGSKVILIPRPRRFGKTLNLSMLKYFYEKESCDNRYLFSNLKINKFKEVMDIQGKYPVIYITFKDEKHSQWERCLSSLERLIKSEFGKHSYILKSDVLAEYEKEEVLDILYGRASHDTYIDGLKLLSEYLYRYYNKKVVILIDEYDVPIQSGFLYGYYDKVIEFMRIFLSGGLKDNVYLEKSVLTGILRVAKESIFSGLNNLDVSTILSYNFDSWFGFLDEEVEELFKYYNIEYDMDNVRNWYNGYIFGDKVIYNPWSVLKYAKSYREGFKPYWVNTSSNDLVKRILSRGGEKLKIELESLIKGEPIEKIVNQDIVIKDIDSSSENTWSFLLFSGYLKVCDRKWKEGDLYCKLTIPNLEVKYLYKQIIKSWFNENVSSDNFNIMLKSLITGDIETFDILFSEYVLKSLSYFDVGSTESEKVYHAFVLGMLVSLNKDYYVKSNRESGYGRYDVMIIPKDINKKGIIIEFKKVFAKEDLEKAALKALKQIREKKYRQELIYRGVKDIIELAIVFEGKNVFIKKNMQSL
ncbi:putative AAA-ATPase [Clostridium tepidiprofundi DSM 19306]|uniref:Putative AAA-ATPase n=1 Tax=Clostridium tepidiprofundi DSM 19306 TaxID=1121338 RepID=A0A151B5G1_9CLOT|nr:AAA family ATPase [Clostridium tepidiprofundi]KYH35154.1 putative AAA-ATPase [Clostridium tepidiprofundi DSM 19306]